MPDTPARQCARREHCGDAQPDDQGAMTGARPEPGLPFCGRCVSAAARALDAMPERYAWLRVHIGRRPAGRPADKVSGTREAPMPIRLEIDALIRDMVRTLCDWEERVADACGLDRPYTADSLRRRDQVALPGAVMTLSRPGRLETLLGLPAEPMTRYVPLRRRMEPFRPGTTGWVHKTAGFAELIEDRSGADAGLDILRLAWQSRRVLGEVIPPPERLDGVPCKACDTLALEACAEPRYRSWCSECGDLLTPGEYLEWIRAYSARARAWVEAGELEPADPAGYGRIAAAGDLEQAASCRRALDGDAGARAECERVIGHARMRAGEDA